MGYSLKVRWVHASLSAANVVEFTTLRDRSNEVLKGNTVRASQLAASSPEVAIAPRARACPKPAARSHIDCDL